MTAPHDQLEAFLDGTLADRATFERHLLRCAACQVALEDALQLIAAGAALSREPDRPQAAAKAVRRSRGRVVGAAVALAAIVVLVLIALQDRGASLDERVASSLRPRRPYAFRLPYAPLDHHRPYDVPRGSTLIEPLPFALIAEIEAQRPTAALVATLLVSADLARAEAALAGAGEDDDLELDRAALALARNRPVDALAHVDRVLLHVPHSAVALWNRAVALDELHLPLAAAEAFDEVARVDEPGWGAEARERARQLRSAENARSERWRQAKAACDGMAAAVPDHATVRANAATCRTAFYEAVRRAPSRDAVLQLTPVAEELDAAAHGTAAKELLDRVTAVEPPLRGRAVALYSTLTKTPDLPEAERRRLLDELRATKQDDLVLGAIPRSRLGGLGAEYIARARATRDPYFLELAEEREADALLSAGDPLGAEVILLRSVRACVPRAVDLRCSYLQLALASIYMTMHRPSELRAIALAGLERSRKFAIYWDERQFFDLLAEAARYEQAHGPMRGYLREATLRSADECAQAQYDQESLAVASIAALRFDQARRDIAAARTCGRSPTPTRARVLAELARFDGTPQEAAALRAGLVKTREDPALLLGQRAQLDAAEGRLLAARDPAAAQLLLRRALATAAQASPNDSDAAIARHDAYTALLVIAAERSDAASVLSLFEESLGTAPRDASVCVVGVMLDAERLLVTTRDPVGVLASHFDPAGVKDSRPDPAAVIPAAVVRRLASCARIDVLALPPVFGAQGLLPPGLPWSYRGRALARARLWPKEPTILTVTDANPPSELGLAPLQSRASTRIAGARHVELRGPDATPQQTLDALVGADVVELHAHGFVDLGVSDASMIALSPQSDGRFALGARQIAGLQLPREPLVILAACHAGYTAPYRHESWGLPRAFLLAGARAVFASPEPISDADAGELFRAIERRILQGQDAAVALRDARAPRLESDPRDWTRAVVLFD
jgi:cellulose synthase operon protein C